MNLLPFCFLIRLLVAFRVGEKCEIIAVGTEGGALGDGGERKREDRVGGEG